MKPWLFNLLACPICKDFPLKLFIFSFESRGEIFKIFLDAYKSKDLTYYEGKNIPKLIENGEKSIKDNIIVEITPLKEYLDKLVSILEEIPYITDKSSYKISKSCFDLAHGEIKDNIRTFLNDFENKNIETLLPELVFLNRLLLESEIESGLLYCNDCHRWYPIIDTIPRMLPDEYRSKEKELEFLNTQKEKLSKEFLNSELKPFSLRKL